MAVNPTNITIDGILRLTGASNQIQLDPSYSANKVTITAAAPAASRTLTIPDPGADASILLTQGAQTVAGVQTFSSGVLVTPTTNQITLGAATNTTVLSATAPAAASITLTLPDPGASAALLAPTAIAVAAATTLTVGQSGSLITVGKGSAYQITLPPVAVGLRYRFIGGATAANAVTIRPAAGSKMTGMWISVAGSAAASAVGGTSSSIVFTATSVPGDTIDIYSDGGLYYATGFSTAAAGIAFA